MRYIHYILVIALFIAAPLGAESADELILNDIIEEALRNNRGLLAASSRLSSARLRPPQARSLPDPMFMLGYQNEGWSKYSYGEMEGAQWMMSLTQTVPFPGKLSLKGKMADVETGSLSASYEALKQRIVLQAKESFFDLFLIHKSLEILEYQRGLLSKVEDAASARYSTGMAPQQEVLMAQTEKYMLSEKEEMLKQKKQAVEAMLNLTLGRDALSPLGMPSQLTYTPMNHSLDELIKKAIEQSPEIKIRQKMLEAGTLKKDMSKKEYYPDFTFTGSVFKREEPFQDMWSLSTAVNIPIFYKKKQRNALLEANSIVSEAQHELESVRQTLASEVRESYSMVKTAEALMGLYKEGLLPKARQGYESATTGYITGRIELITLIRSLKSLFDYEILYWAQFVEREKAAARLNALIGSGLTGGQEN